jgi:GNAT superfamily N-acetyltransferase
MSEYDDIVRGMVAPTADENRDAGGDDYDRAVQQVAKEKTGRARVSLGAALDTNPDDAARASALAKQVGLPTEVVERNRPEIERKTKVEEYDALLESSPKLRDRFARDQSFAKQAHDDVENLSWWEKSGRVSTSMAEPGIRNKADDSGVLPALGGGAAQATLGISESIWRTPDSLTRGFEFLSETVERTGLPRMLNPVRGAETLSRAVSEGVSVPGTDVRTYGTKDAADAVGDATQTLAEGPETFGDTFARLQEKGQMADEALQGALSGDPEKLGQVLTDPEAWAGFIGQAAPSLYLALKSGGSLPFLAWLESMEVANDVADFEERTGQRVEPEQFVQAQAQVALVNSWLERTGLEKVLGGKGGPLTSFLRGVGFEGGTEGLQALNTNAAIFAAYDQDKKLTESVLGGVMGGAGTGGVAGGIEGMVRKSVENEARAQQAQQTGETIDQVAETARASKLRERNPEAFEEYVAEATADSPVQDVYIDARKFSEFFQSQGIDPAQIAEEMPSVRAQLAEAEATGGDLKIPLAEYATRLAPTDYYEGLRDLTRFNPEDMSPAEAAEWQETKGEDFEREAQQILDRRIEDDAFQQSARQVEDTVRQQILETGRFTNDVADKYASLHGAFATTMADRLGVQPADIYERYGLQVRAEGLQMDGAQYDQAPASLDEIKTSARDAGLDVAVRERGDVITLDKIVVPEDGRGQGAGTQTMQALVDYADAQSKAIALSPTDDFGGDTKRLREFYQRFGFVENKGADKAYSVSESMLRMPQDSDLTLYQSAYHGTPHQFDEFSLDAIGTGEGAQAFGWGLYFAGKREIAEFYRNNLTNDSEIDSLRPANDAEEYVIEKIRDYRDEVGAAPDKDAIGQWMDQDRDTGLRTDDEFGPGYLYQGDLIPDDSVDEAVRSIYEQLPEGTLYQVDIPDDNELLDWDATLAEQPAEVQEKLRAFSAEYGDLYPTFSESMQGIEANATTGESLYHALAQDAGSLERASSDLNRMGIPGSRYLDATSRDEGEGSRNYVIWDEDRVTVEAVNDELRQAQEYEQSARGKIQFPNDLTEAPSVISLLERADLSSFLHESGHFFFEVMTDMAAQPDAPAQIRQDMQTLLDWYGIDSLETWQQMDAEQRREYHEQFARGFEAYLFEGNAPNVEMQGLFQRFRAWLVAVYKNLRNLDVELTDEVRGVMDRMLATDAQIESAQAAMNLQPMFRSADEAGMTEAEFAEYQERHREAIDEATETLQERSLRDMKWLANAKSRKLKELQREAKTKRKAVQAEVAEEVARRPVYAAEEFLRRGIVEGPDGERIDVPSGHKLAVPALRDMYGEQDAPKSDPETVDPALDDLPTAIAKLGGLDRKAASAEGIDPAHWRGRAANTENQPVFGKRVFRKEGGLAVDSMAEALAQYGYLDEEATPNALLDKLNDALRGEEVYSSRADFNAIYGVPGADLIDAPDWRSLGYGKYGMLAGTGVDPEVAAGWFGFTSADEMVRALVDAEPRRDVIEAGTDIRMLERYGDLADPQAMERAAEAAIHNDARARFAATELNYLNRAAGRGRINTRAAKAFAERYVAGQQVREIKPSRWQAAEARAARESEKARRQGDLPAAARAKQDQLVQGYTVRAATDARTEIDKLVDYLKKFEREGVRKNLRGDFVGQLDALLTRFDLRKGQSLKKIDQRQTLREWMESFSEENSAIVPEIDPRILDEAYRKHYKDMTLDELRGLRDSVKQLEQLARRENQMYLESRQQSFEEEKGAILDELRNAHPETFDAEGDPRGFEKSYVPKFGERMKRLRQKGAAEFLNVETLVQLVTVGKFGQLHDSLVQRLSDRSDWKIRFQQELGDHLRPYLKAYGLKESRRFATKPVYIPEINDSLTREQMVTTTLYYGSETGRQRLRDGHGWGMVEMRAVTDRLTQKDVDLVDAIWRMHDEMVWPELAAVQERTTGQAPEKVEPLPFDTKFGTLRGGYHPIVYDSDLDYRQAKYDQGQAVQDMLGGKVWKATTPQGSSKARLEEVSKRLVLDFGGMNKALGDTIHDIAYREAVADTYRLVNDKTLRAGLEGIGGVDLTRSIEQQIRNVAAVPRAPMGFIENTLSWMRRNTLIVTMGFSIKTFLINATGIAASWRRVGIAPLSQEVSRFAASPFDSTRFVNERSDYMEFRNRSYDRDLTRQVAQVQAKKRLTPDVATALSMIGWMDRAVSYPTWMAAYQEALNGKVRGEPSMDADRAAKYADHVVRQTQGSGREVDVARIMEGKGAGGQLKNLFTMFYSYFNAQLAQLVRSGVVEADAMRNGDPWAVARLGQAFLAVIVLPAVTGALLYGNCDDDVENNGAAAGYGKCFARESVLFAGGFVPIVRDVVASLWAAFDDDAPFYGYQITPVESAGSGMVRGVKSIGDVAGGEGDIKDVKAITLGASYALGLPGYQAWRSMEHAYSVSEGEADFNAWYLLMGEPKD